MKSHHMDNRLLALRKTLERDRARIGSLSYKLETSKRTNALKVRIPVEASQAEAIRALKQVQVKVARDGIRRLP